MAGYLTTQSRLDTIFPTSSDQKAVMMESVADVVVGQEKTGEGVCKQFLSENGGSRLLIFWTL